LAKPIGTLFLLWAISLGVIAVLQMVGGGVGFRIGPLGEDFNWVYFLQHHEEQPAQQAFWAHDARNPLAPWWYVAVKPLVIDAAYGLYAVRKVVDLVCGLAVYAVIASLGGAAARRFAGAAGALALLWSCSGIVGQINWTMLMAASASLLAVAAYGRFLAGGRSEAGWLAGALVLYLVALATYTLQASAVLAIAGIGALRQGWRRGLVDALPFGGVLVVFGLIWSTVGYVPAETLRVDGSAVGRVVQSLAAWVWDPVYGHVLQELVRYYRGDLAVCAVGAVVLGVVFFRLCGEPGESEDGGRLARELGLVVVGLGAGTVALEMTSTLWVPGTRAPMIQQLMTPLLVALLWLALPVRWSRVARWAAFSGAALLALGANARQTRWTADLEQIGAGLRAAVPKITAPTMFVMTQPALGVSPYNSDVFVKNLYRSNDVNLKIFSPSQPGVPGVAYAELVFDSDAKGMLAENTMGHRGFILRKAATWVPYRQVVLMRYEGAAVRRVNVLRKEDTAGYQVTFQRDQPLYAGERKPGPPVLLDRWEMSGAAQAAPGGVELSGRPLSIAQHPVGLRADFEYVVEFEARGEGDTSAFYADLYGGPGYDAAEQDHTIGELGREFRWVRFVIPAGTAPPPETWLRLVNPSPGTVWVRSVRISRLDTMEVGLLRP
jgi:hypothetical protein